MPIAILAAIITATTAALVPLGIWLLNRWTEKRAQLRVNIEIFPYKEAPNVAPLVENYRQALGDDWGHLDYVAIRQRIPFDGFIRLTIENISNKRLDNVSVVADLGRALYSVSRGTEDFQFLDKDFNTVVVGNLQPHHKATVALWTVTEHHSYLRPDLFRISADELDHVLIRYPHPEYLKRRNTIWPRWVGQAASLIGFFVLSLSAPVLIVALLIYFFGLKVT